MVSNTLKKVLCAMGPWKSTETFVEVTLQLRLEHASIILGCGVSSLEVVNHAKDQKSLPWEKTGIPERRKWNSTTSYPSVEGWNSRCRSHTQSFVFVVLLGLLALNSTVRFTLLILLLVGLFSHLYLKEFVIYIYIYLIHIFFKNPSHYHLTKNLRNRVREN